ncbi:RodZ family helix-turn-helix domain-containing protein [Lactobacillus sp. ESL0230]|uniref:helix-turn-helix domain-containing protein n=1 Tax=Lactobacillus sp. ESL0230 TaxID=2069353 RepID=UPI000EFD5FE9|nr:helix-turn-helix domain-containing protein [Lactobacillus sp. ESL0230]RMC46166.1 helix-turn-helix domain-containing protein [Lactobacillus sp. ESL0230]
MADIGDKLRSAREAKGLSIEDVEKATKIQGRYLTAIEQNDFDKLPGDFYVRAFIRQYAQVVGLDGKELLNEYHQEIPQAEPDEYVEESIDNKSEEVSKTTNSKKKLWKDYLPRIIIILGIVVVVLVCYMVYAHFSSAGNQNNNSASDVSVSSENTSRPKKVKKAKPNLVKVRELAVNQYEITGLKKNRNIVVRAGDQVTTISVAMNGVNQGAQTLTAGQKHTVRIPESAQTVVVTFSNALGTTVSVGGKKVPYNGQSAGLSLTLFIGKHHQVQRNGEVNQNNNTGNANTGTTQNQRTETEQNQDHHQTNNTENNSTTNNNQSTGQQTNGQVNHDNQTDTTDHHQANNNSSSSSDNQGGSSN